MPISARRENDLTAQSAVRYVGWLRREIELLPDDHPLSCEYAHQLDDLAHRQPMGPRSLGTSSVDREIADLVRARIYERARGQQGSQTARVPKFDEKRRRQAAGTSLMSILEGECYWALWWADVVTLEELRELSERDLLGVPQLGPKRVAEILGAVERHDHGVRG